MSNDLVRRELSAGQLQNHVAALRQVAVVGRNTFTDSVKSLCEYVDPVGDMSKSGGKAYVHFTRQLYRCLGLTKQQADSRINGENFRDVTDGAVLMVLYTAEIECASIIESAIKNKELRTEIKRRIKECFERHAETYRRIRTNWGQAT